MCNHVTWIRWSVDHTASSSLHVCFVFTCCKIEAHFLWLYCGQPMTSQKSKCSSMLLFLINWQWIEILMVVYPPKYVPQGEFVNLSICCGIVIGMLDSYWHNSFLVFSCGLLLHRSIKNATCTHKVFTAWHGSPRGMWMICKRNADDTTLSSQRVFFVWTCRKTVDAGQSLTSQKTMLR